MHAPGTAVYAMRLLVALIIIGLIWACVAMAQDPPAAVKTLPTDTVPAWVFYWVVGGLAAGYLALGKVIHYLWGRLDTDRTKSVDDMKSMSASNAESVSALGVKLSAEQASHLAAVERLKGESAEFGREAIKQLAVNSEAIEDMTAVVTQLRDHLNESRGGTK